MKWLRIFLVVVILSLSPVGVVLADTTADVTLYATPAFSSGLTNFTIIYVSHTELDFTWGYSANASKIMIRAKYGKYPSDIADNLTTPSDGYLVYYGSGVSATDTSMDFDQNPGKLYYKAWAQFPDGSWGTVPSSGNKESRAMALIAIILFASLVSGLALWKMTVPLGFVASGSWFGVLAYTRTNPIGDIVIGSSADTFFVWVFVGAALLIPLLCYRSNRDKQIEITNKSNTGNQVAQLRERRNGFNSESSEESYEEYQARIHGLLRTRRVRR